MPRALGPCRKASQEPCGPVSTTEIHGTCLQPRESQPIAVAMAVGEACPSLRHVNVNESVPTLPLPPTHQIKLMQPISAPFSQAAAIPMYFSNFYHFSQFMSPLGRCR